MAKEYKTFKEELPKVHSVVWVKQGCYSERARVLEDNTLELILPTHKVMSMVTIAEEWRDDDY